MASAVTGRRYEPALCARRSTFEEMGYQIHNPSGEPYNETRTDCEASIAGSKVDNLVVAEVIKPIVRRQGVIIQKGVVIVESK